MEYYLIPTFVSLQRRSQKRTNAMKTYIITNDRYSNQPDEVTFDQLIELCNEAGFATNFYAKGDNVTDERGEVVAVEKSVYEASIA